MVNGTYTLQSLATDSAGNTAYSTGDHVTVNNTPPTTAVLVPANGASVSGTSATLDASGQCRQRGGDQQGPVRAHGRGVQQDRDRHGDATIYGYVSRGTRRAWPTGPTPCRAWPPTAPGTPPTAPAITVTVGNTPPTTAVLIPSNSATVSGTARDARRQRQRLQRRGDQQGPVRAHRWDVQQDGDRHGDATIYGYCYSWNSESVADGTYTLQSLATDGAGNTTYSAGITIKVSN